MRKPGTKKLVYNTKTRTIEQVRFNRFKRAFWWLKEVANKPFKPTEKDTTT